MHTITVKNAGFELLRHELPDQQVLEHRIIASNGLIALRVTMSCRPLLRRVASRGVLPRERFSPMARLEPPVRSAIAPLSGAQRISCDQSEHYCWSPRTRHRINSSLSLTGLSRSSVPPFSGTTWRMPCTSQHIHACRQCADSPRRRSQRIRCKCTCGAGC